MINREKTNTTNQLPVFDMFYSIQGEGYNTGMAGYFIRLAGCNVGCKFCDEKMAWKTNDTLLQDVDTIVEKIKKENAQNVIITGGEPTLYDLNNLTKELHRISKKTFLESSGVNEISGYWDWITLSPKQSLLPLDSSLLLADEIKVVIQKAEDFLFAEKMLQKANDPTLRHKPKTINYLQPEYSEKENILPLIIEYIKQNPTWRLSLQTHKMINIK
jgi:7-carboxy-7-deazaguanine synthase